MMMMQPKDFKKDVRLYSKVSGKTYIVKSVNNNRSVVTVAPEVPGKVYKYKVSMHRAVLIFEPALAEPGAEV